MGDGGDGGGKRLLEGQQTNKVEWQKRGSKEVQDEDGD